jgi:arylsulfatase A-like enzyme
MKERAKKNFMLLIESSDPERGAASYEGAVAAVDSFVGNLVKAFRDLGLDNRATLVVFGTNGADLGDHGTDGGPSLHPTVTHVPLLVRFPGGARAHTVEEYVEIADLGPTLLAAAGIAPHGNVHGRSLLSLIRGEGKPPYVAFGESPHRGGQRFVALGGYQLIHSTEGARDEVYQLSADPLGKNDISAAEAQRIAVLAGHLGAWERLAAAASLDPDKQAAQLDDATLQKLKSLGYVQ